MKESQRPTLESLLSRGHIHEAIDALDRTASGAGFQEIKERIAGVREAYTLLTRYALEGAPDPSRADLYADIAASLRDIAASLRRARMAKDSPTLYFSTLRYEALNPAPSIAALASEYGKLTGSRGLALMTGEGVPALEARIDSVEKQIFNRLWTTHPLSADDAAAIDALIADDDADADARQLIVAALMMGELEWHDDRRIISLVKAYRSGNTAISVKALCALLAALWIHRKRPMRRRVADAIAAAADEPSWASDMRMAFLQMIRARDTERVNRRISEEIIPGLMKMKPDIEKKLRDGHAPLDVASFEDNPEWEEMLDKSGIKDRLKEISEMQEEGMDVMMSTFGNLKSFPFFNEIHHWFIPFRQEHPAVAASASGSGEWAQFVDVVSSSAFLCDNDKYSLACAFSLMPADNRAMLLSRFKSQNLDMAELKASTLSTANTDREQVANRWIQSIYRFFKLFRRKGEFDDIFAEPLNPLEIPLLAELFDDADTLGLAAEFYFKRGYWAEAHRIFSRMAELVPVTPQMLQKMGTCLQRTGDIAGAIAHYEHAELLNADNLWTLRRLGACHRLAGNPAKALPYLRRVALERPDDLGAALSLGHCLTETGHYDEAVKQYFKVEFHDPDNRKALRPLAWALMLNGDTAKARQYYDRLLADSPEPDDRLNAAHLSLLEGRWAEAAAGYFEAIRALEFDLSKFTDLFESDLPVLLAHGVDPLMAKIVLDASLDAARKSGSHLSPSSNT